MTVMKEVKLNSMDEDWLMMRHKPHAIGSSSFTA